MENGNDRFEDFLREFAPRQPRALELPPARTPVWRRRLAAVAAIPAMLGIFFLLWSHHNEKRDKGSAALAGSAASTARAAAPPRLLLLSMTQKALTNPEQLDADLAEASRNLLPNFRKANSTLRVLAKE